MTPVQNETDFDSKLFLNRRDIQVFRLSNDNGGYEPISQPNIDEENNDNEENKLNNLEVTSMAKVTKVQKGTLSAQRIMKCESVPKNAVVEEVFESLPRNRSILLI